MRIRPAEPKDLENILSIYDTAKKFMRAHHNMTQWAGAYPSPALLLDDMAKGQLFLCEADEKPCGVFAFILGDDPTYALIEDGAWPSDAPYGTIHRIASDGTQKGVLKEACDFAFNHCTHLRADTHHDNYVMQNAMVRLGFKYCGIIYVQDGTPRKAYQKDL